ncbi:Clathrin heavy chain 1 [Durusdinium trenchii]|uniref:Clathrin heavy chain n=1 Tax=Durusdinium trenchii TaxID=1381693 RepID=A0ABP0Q0W8_9DINO
MAELPLTLNTTIDLASQGINAQAFKFNSLTMESDKYISIKDTAPDGTAQVVVVDMHNNNAVNKRPMKAEATLMNPQDNIIALKAASEGQPGHFVQIFNLDTKEKLGVYQCPEQIVFWRWLAPRMLALVCAQDVYHWNLATANSQPEKIFQRAGKLAEAGTQIINYSANSQVSWCLLTGISSQDQGRTIDGNMQLYSVERKQQQLLEGHAGCFGNVYVDDGGVRCGVFAFQERKAGQPGTKLHIMDILKNRGESAPPFKVQQEIAMPPEAPTDFAVGLHLSEKHGVIFMVTKAGFLFMFDIGTGTMLVRSRVSQETVFITVGSALSGGIIFVNKRGAVMSAKVNEAAIANYIINQLVQIPNRQDIAFNMAKRFGLPGADELFQRQFNQLFASGDYKGAALIAAQCKSGLLRTPQTIQQFKSVQAPPGQSSPILHYFSTLLEHNKLNALESVELVRPVVQQGRRELIEKWLKEDKLECTEELGDIVRPLETKFALSIYLRAQIHQKVIQCFVELGQIDQIVAYVKRVGYQADYTQLLQNMVASNPEGATNFAKSLLEGQNGVPLIDINQVVKVFMDQNRLQETTSILLDALKANKPDQAHLQTQLLAMNLQQAPKVAEAILQMNMFTHYDRAYIGQLCEKAGLMQWAMEHYTDGADLKRVMMHAHQMTPEFLIQYFSRLSPETALECLTDLMRHNRQNLQVAVKVAIQYHEQIGAVKIVEMFESFGSNEGIFYFLGAILNTSTDPDVHFKYIQAASRVGNMQEVERVCRESQVYDPTAVKNFLKEAKLPDPRPLIYVCDLHDFVEELTDYLYKNSLMKYIEVYVVKVNPLKCPQVIGSLIDLDCSEDFIKTLLQNVRAACPAEPLVEQIEKRNRLRLLLPWLEARVAEGNQDPHLHNAMAKILIDTNRDPENFLKTNAFYDSKIVGKYCEDRDPHLAYTAYKRAWGSCDEQLVDVTNRNGLFRLQARYLVERQSPDLWALVLTPDNQYRRNVIDQVVSTALPESTNADEVSATVKAFISADLPTELIELLEKIVLHNSDFSKNRNLQNLLVLTAIKADKARVMDYINRLDNYDGPEIAKIALGDPYGLYEEAFLIYKKCGQNAEAMDVLLENINSLERAQEFAARINDKTVWYKLGKAQLETGGVPESVDSYLKSEDATDYLEVIQAAEREENYEELVRYLMMARTKVKDSQIDGELVYAYAKTERLGEMEEFISGTNTANIQAVGDRLYDEKFYKAAKILYASIPNNGRLASCHVQLGEYTQAVEAAKKANNPKTWQEVNLACVKAEQFRCAEIAGQHIIVHPDHLEEVISQYEKQGCFDALMQLLESGLGNERAHVGMYTELATMYAKYKPKMLMDFIKMNVQKLNIPKLIHACERHYHWEHAVFLYTHYDEYDQAANTMMAHSPIAFAHDQFLMIMQKVSNMELYYRAVQFYLDEQPLQLNSLLSTITPKVDHARVVQQVKKAGQLPLIMPYMKQVQQHNIAPVNEAINDIYVDGEQYEELRQSIEEFDNFDQIALAQKLEKHELIEMRRIATLVYQKNKRYKQAIELAQHDKMYKDCMDSAMASGNQDLAEGLLKYFVEKEMKECFAACLYTCYDLIRPDIALELAWKSRNMDFAMPYLIQVMREYTDRVNALDKKTQKKEEEEEKQKSAPNDYVPDYMMLTMGPGLTGFGNLALTSGPANMQPMMGNTMNMGMQPQPGMQPSMMMTPNMGGF